MFTWVNWSGDRGLLQTRARATEPGGTWQTRVNSNTFVESLIDPPPPVGTHSGLLIATSVACLSLSFASRRRFSSAEGSYLA